MLVGNSANFDKVVDVVIVGYGMAGAVSAITAHDFGAEVLILEKQQKEGLYNTSSLSGGGIIGSSDVKKTIQYMEGLNLIGADSPWTEPEIVKVWAEYAADNKNWMQKLGGNIRLTSTGGEHSEVDGYESIEVWGYYGSGIRMMKFFNEQVTKRGIEVSYNTTAIKLLADILGEVVGVRVQTGDGKKMDIGASKGVILASGGFEFNERMKLNYLRLYPAHFGAGPTNTGDGIRMAQALGADLWHMNCCSARWVAKIPGYAPCFAMELGGKGWMRRKNKEDEAPEPAGYIVVDRYGKRFTSENHKNHCAAYELTVFDTQRLQYSRIPCYWIFDQNRLGAGPLCATTSGPAGPHQLYHWSEDNLAEMGKGWFISGKTIKELAGKIDMPADNLETTIATYNRYCSLKKDSEFKRFARDLIPLDKPPFYAFRMWPGGPNTQGGPRRNSNSQILNTDGDPIKRLYAAGEMGSIFGMMYPGGGGNLSECIVFGRIAGQNAAKEKSRSPGHLL